jgi:hypothetical protein
VGQLKKFKFCDDYNTVINIMIIIIIIIKIIVSTFYVKSLENIEISKIFLKL